MLAKYALLAPANDNATISTPFVLSPAPVPVLVSAPPAPLHLDRDEAIRRIKSALKARSGKSWSVTGGRGTGWGWIKIDTMPARKRFDWDGQPTDSEFGYMSKDERVELATLLGLDPARMSPQGESVPASSAYREEYVARAEGRTPERFGTQYWD